mgnify:CR=1 FL=1
MSVRGGSIILHAPRVPKNYSSEKGLIWKFLSWVALQIYLEFLILSKKNLKTIKLNVLLYFDIFNSLKIDVYDFIFGKQNILLKRFTYIFL